MYQIPTVLESDTWHTSHRSFEFPLGEHQASCFSKF